MLTAVIVSDYGHPIGGAEKVAIDSAIGLAELGVRVHFLAGVGPVDERLRASGVMVHLADVPELSQKGTLELLATGLWSRACAALARRVLRDLPRGQTIIHVHCWQRALTTSTLRACRESGHPMILTLHDYGSACPNQGFFDYHRGEICTRRALGVDCLRTNCDSRTYAHKLWRAARTTLQHVAAAVPEQVEDVIYVSAFSRAILEPYFPATTRWHAVRNPITVVRRPRVQAELNRPFLFVGRVTPEKGIQLFAEATAKAVVPGIVVGEGPALDDVRRDFPKLSYLGRLPADRVHEAFASARALVFPSIWYETQGMVVQEAKASGLPLLVADRTAAREAVQEGETGLLFRHMDVGHLAEQMAKLAADDALIAAMSERAHAEYWRDPPSLQQHIAALVNLYERRLSLGTREAAVAVGAP